MIKSLFILGFIACLTGTSLCGKNYGFRRKAHDNFDVYDEYKGALRMQYNDYDQAEYERNDAYEFDRDTGTEHLRKDAANEMKLTNTTLATDKQKIESKVLANNKPIEMTQNNNHTLTVSNSTVVQQVHGAYSDNAPFYNNRFVILRYYLFKKNDSKMYVLDGMPNINLNRDVFFLIHGHMKSNKTFFQQDDYVMQFFKSLSLALLGQYDCNVVGLFWSFKEPHQPNRFAEYKAAILVGRMFGNDVNNLRRNQDYRKRISIISHDLGNVVAASLSYVVKKPVNLIYGLDQRPFPIVYRNYYLRQDSAELVQILTTNGMKYNYGHRNFFPNGGNTTQNFYAQDKCYFCQSYRLLSADIMQNGNVHIATFCSTFDDFFLNRCKSFPKISYFDRSPAKRFPLGNYFTTEDISPPFIDNEGQDGKGDIWES